MKRRIISGAILAALFTVVLVPSALAEEKGMLDKYMDKYWAEKRDVRVIQKRLYQKDGRIELTPFFGMVPNDEFNLYFPTGLRASYFISEDIAIELFGSYMFHQDSDLASFIYDSYDGGLEAHIPQRLWWTAGVEGLWSPIHGKFGVFTTKLAHFDWFLAIGVGAMATEVSTQEVGGKTDKKYDVAGNVGTGLRLFVLDWLALRLEYRNYIFAAEAGGVSHPVELSLGVSFFVN